VPGLQDKFVALEAALEGELIDRSEEIRCAMLALVAGCTFFMVGPPGVAKSLLARRVAGRISEAEFFDAQLDRMSTPELLFGPWSLSALRAGRWERELAGTLATAHLAHIDEVFAAGSTLLQGLHWALNERLYRHGASVIPIPLSTVFCSANTVPSDPAIAAFWDRLILRRSLSAEMDAGDFKRMLTSAPSEKPEPVLSWADVTEAQVTARAVVLPEPVLGVVYRISRKMKDVGIHPSPRRYRMAMDVVRASAWLDGRAGATSTDLLVLKDILWLFPDQVVTVRQLVDKELEKSISPTVLLLRELRRLRGQVTLGLPKHERLALAEELGEKLREAKIELDALERRGRSTTTAQCRRVIEETEELILVRLFQSNPEEADFMLGGGP
jgi:MoxR-like ATPase